ncbi:GNAT family N-acetyltransferase [Ideonella margarita]|uniref:GNAT family protein n=1 Tax=Ideonella margarita TaxID=2984191 RepID=A0ABU9C399_9BURK
MPFMLDAPIVTPRLLVRSLHADDLPDLLVVNGDDAVTHHLPYPSWAGMDDATAWAERVRQREQAGDTLQLVLQRRDTGQVIGACLLFKLDEPSGRAELGYVLGQAHWHGGWMFEACEALVAHAFGPLGLRRLEAEVNPANAASMALIRRLGFTQEGLLRQRWTAKGRTYDIAFFGLLASDLKTTAD